MKLADIFDQGSEWLLGAGPHHDIVVSSRIRLARNLRNFAFPGWARKVERVKVLEMIKPAVEELPEMQEAFSQSLQELAALDKQVLVERHLISREHAAKGTGSAVVINRKQTLSIMINEEDHLRMQAIRPGLQLKNAFKMIDRVDTALEAKLEYAFHPHLGYLTACPTNVGTGLRASAMVHLPALVLGNHINQIVQSVNKIGLAVRGLYGEGTEAMGNLFQVSNQSTLGQSEDRILGDLNKVIEQIIGHEQNARKVLLESRPATLLDHVGRAYGILTHAHSMSSKEALNLLSFMKLGVDLGFFPEDRCRPIDELFMETQPAHLQKSSRRKLTADERDTLRADIIRAKLKTCPEPDIHKVVPRSAEAGPDPGTATPGPADPANE